MKRNDSCRREELLSLMPLFEVANVSADKVLTLMGLDIINVGDTVNYKGNEDDVVGIVDQVIDSYEGREIRVQYDSYVMWYKEEELKIIKKADLACKHEFLMYNGFTSAYEYCSKCGLTKDEC